MIHSVPLLCLMMAASPAVEVRTLDGDAISGALTELTVEGVTIHTGDRTETISTDRLIAIVVGERPVATQEPPKVQLDLVDGSRLGGSRYQVVGDQGVFLRDQRALGLSTRDVAAVQFQPAVGSIASEWDRLRQERPLEDLLVIRKADSIDYLGGVVRDVTAGVVQFELDGDLLPVGREKVFGVVYAHSDNRRLDSPVCRLAEKSGGLWQVGSIRLDGDRLVLTSCCGVRAEVAMDEVLRLDYSQGKVVYLSDLTPSVSEWTPYFPVESNLAAVKRFHEVRSENDLPDKVWSIDGRVFEKGLSVRSRTELLYRLPDAFRRFQAVVGIDDRVRPRGSVQLVIRGEDRVLLDRTVDGTEDALEVDLDISGVRNLQILVDFGEGLGMADHLNLCDARLTK